MLLLVSCSRSEATSTDTLITKEHQVTNIWVIDSNEDGKPDGLLIELCLNGKFDKTLVFNEIGFYIGDIRQIDGVLTYTDLTGKTTPFKPLETTPKLPPKQT